MLSVPEFQGSWALKLYDLESLYLIALAGGGEWAGHRSDDLQRARAYLLKHLEHEVETSGTPYSLLTGARDPELSALVGEHGTLSEQLTFLREFLSLPSSSGEPTPSSS